MRRSRLAIAAASSVTAFLCGASSAFAVPVIVLGSGGRVQVVNDRFLDGSGFAGALLGGPPLSFPGAPAGAVGMQAALSRDAGAGQPPTGGAAPSGPPTTTPTTTTPTSTTPATTTPITAPGTKTTPGSSTGPGSKHGSQATVVSVLSSLAAHQEITAAQHQRYLSEFEGALADEKHLHGTRLAELTAVTETMHQIAVSGQMTASRLPAIFLTVQRNTQWWTTGPLLSADERVKFSDSQLVWEYYPGAGIQLQPLATFGEANGMYTAGPSEYPAFLSLLAQMLPLAAAQDHGITWDYYFPFDGGQPPWSSAMTDGTALEAFTRAYLATGDHQYLVDGAEILPLLRDPPPRGLSVRTPRGRRFIQYSFTPGTSIINAFLQTLIGLYYFSHTSGNLLSLSLFNQGTAEAQAEVPSFDTGAWSLYQPGLEDTLSYHQLVTGFLAQLCTLTAAPAYCQTAAAFQSDLTTPPDLTLVTAKAPAKHEFHLAFKLSKASRVGAVILSGSQTVFSTSASFGYGAGSVTVPKLARGSYTVRMSATDLAGNFARITGTLQVGAPAG
jgi:hypothetical protein